MLTRLGQMVLLAGLFIGSLTVQAAKNETQFNRDIRPILSDNCFRCHGPDKNQRKAKLRLDDREIALERGAIVPGKPNESELVRRIFTKDADDLMPPPEIHKQLAPAQKELLKRWIVEGAKYEPHWAYITPQRPEVPQIRNPKSEIRNPIDAFILRTLEAHKIKPSPETDKRTLLRRLSLDLTGLPPTPEEVTRFVADTDPRAYERAVDRLLASPHFGERMAGPWLDLVRFADTVGYHGDQNQRIFPYRDYVIDSFNKNKPFDQFTMEQIAGDQLPNPAAEQLVATGFNRLNMMTREGGAQPKEYLAKYAADRVRTVATTWLGSTMACCECHDHKYDPFSTKDFYSMAAFFADVKQWGVYNDYNYTPNPDLKGWSNDHPFPPELQVESPYLKRRIEKLRQEMRVLCEGVSANLVSDSASRSAFEEWQREGITFLKQSPSGWAAPQPEVSVSTKNTNGVPDTSFTVAEDRSILLTGKPGERVQVRLPLATGWLSAIRLELLPHEKHSGKIVRGDGKNTSINLTAALRRNGRTNETRLAFFHAEADHKEDRYVNGFEILGVKDSWRTSAEKNQSLHTAVWLLDKPIRVNEGDSLAVGFGDAAAIGCVRISVSPFASDDPLNRRFGESLLAASEAKASDPKESHTLVQQTYLASTGWNADAFAQYKKLYREILECREGRAWTMITEAWEPRTTRVLPRGNWQDENGEIVQATPPHFLPATARPAGQRFTRLDLARWLVSPENPLTARTMVNRLWKQFFGVGICSTVDDLGLQGDPPSHPELLDWLAVEFMQPRFANHQSRITNPKSRTPLVSSDSESSPHSWDIKHLVRLIVTSSTYRQSSNQRPELRETDPNNRLLASQNPRRLEAELVRDNALFIAGLINLDIGGPSAFPYQPPGYYANLQFPDRDYVSSRDDRQYRRGVYAHWQRTFLQPMMANFDAPSREECTAFRIVSNTPQQALTLLNDQTFNEAARVLAQALLASGSNSDDSRIAWAYQKALSRPPKRKELKSLKEFLLTQRSHYQTDREEATRLLSVGFTPRPDNVDDAELAAWTQACRVILNLHETITVY